jgi:curli biogenesis system outer membrane secretion channel CsgG
MKSQLTSYQKSITKTSFLLLCALCVFCGELSAADDPFKDLASTLGKEAPGEKVNIAVGSFNYENTDLQSPFSSMLRDELEIALGESGKFKVVTRDRLADLQMEGKFQGKGILEPGTGVEKVTIEGVKGIIRGRFYASGDEVTVYAELAWLEGGEVKNAVQHKEDYLKQVTTKKLTMGL